MENQYNDHNSEEQKPQYQYHNPLQSQLHKDLGKSASSGKHATKVLGIIGLALIFGLVASATFITSNLIGNKLLTENVSPVAMSAEIEPEMLLAEPASNIALTRSASVITSDVSDIVEAVMPSVVSITNLSVQEVRDFFGGIFQDEREGAGTGIIIAENETELLIVTNHHVVAGYETLTITFIDGNSIEAHIKGMDPLYDLAVVAVPLNQISAETMEQISVAQLGDSTQLRVGEPAIAIGNALGFGQSVTTGVISALETRPIFENGYDTSNVRLLQTDAAINPGNSGGALVNANGEVIGINSSKLVGATIEGVGYAIPVSEVSDIITQLMNQETRIRVSEDERGFLGIKGASVTSESAQRYHMPVGVFVSEVSPGGGAERAGLTRGSVITGLNGVTITSMEMLQGELQYFSIGTTVTLTIQVPENNGDYTEQTLEVILGVSVS